MEGVVKQRIPKKKKHEEDHVTREIFKPGFTRLSLPYFIPEDQLDYVLQAVAMVAERGWTLLPQYKMNIKTAEWKHKDSPEGKQHTRLDQLSYTQGYLEVRTPRATEEQAPDYGQCLDLARQIFAQAGKNVVTIPDQTHYFQNSDTEYARWFLLPSEASEVLKVISKVSHLGPVQPILSPGKAGAMGHQIGGVNLSPTSHTTSSTPLPTSRGLTLTGGGGHVSAQRGKAASSNNNNNNSNNNNSKWNRAGQGHNQKRGKQRIQVQPGIERWEH